MTSIAVLMSAYKAQNTIKKTIDSLNANMEPHDLYLVDDGSPIPISSYLEPQSNLTIIRSSTNIGLAQAQNLGLKEILAKNYSYIACIDADDAALPDRLHKQRIFLDQHPDIGLVGSWGRVVSETDKTVFHLHPPADHDEIMTDLYYNNCFLHPSLMIRTSMFRKYGNYSNDYPSAEDYEIILRFAQHTKIANMSKYLLDYRLSTTGISLTKRREQIATRLKLQWEYRSWGNIHFYLGLTKTFILSFLPYQFITFIKKHKKSYKKR